MFKTALKIKRQGIFFTFILTLQKVLTFGASNAMVSEDSTTNNETYRK